MKNHYPPIYDITQPAVSAGPFVFDSPHSGTIYPADFNYACPMDVPAVSQLLAAMQSPAAFTTYTKSAFRLFSVSFR